MSVADYVIRDNHLPVNWGRITGVPCLIRWPSLRFSAKDGGRMPTAEGARADEGAKPLRSLGSEATMEIQSKAGYPLGDSYGDACEITGIEGKSEARASIITITKVAGAVMQRLHGHEEVSGEEGERNLEKRLHREVALACSEGHGG